MKRTLHIKTKVLPGGRIVVEDPGLTEGDEVDVMVSAAAASTGRSASYILAKSEASPSFKRAEEVDDYIREERDSWHN